jgi:hypothetical protein
MGGLGLTDIVEKAHTRLAAILTGYTIIYDIFAPERENKRVLDKGYGVIWDTITEYDGGATRNLTSRALLNVIMTYGIVLRGDIQPNLTSFYANIETVIRSFKDGSRLGSTYLVDIGAYSVTKPKLIEGKEHILCEVGFQTQFRVSI